MRILIGILIYVVINLIIVCKFEAIYEFVKRYLFHENKPLHDKFTTILQIAFMTLPYYICGRAIGLIKLIKLWRLNDRNK